MTLVSIPANPVPEDVVTGTIKTPDGAELRFARWAPPPNRKGTVCVFQGRAEFIEKYYETVRDLRARGFAVAMIDWRGQGHSARRLRDPRKGYVRDFADYETDVETFVRSVVMPDCPPPFYALAHSMGGAVMLRVAYSQKRWFDRIVLSAPMIDLPGRTTGLPSRGPAARDALDRPRRPVRADRHERTDRHRSVRRQSGHLRSGALCAQRGGARGRPGARACGADRRLGGHRVPRHEHLQGNATTRRKSASRC